MANNGKLAGDNGSPVVGQRSSVGRIAIMTQILKNVRARIEADQLALDMDQAATIHGLCVGLGVDPVEVLGEEVEVVEVRHRPPPAIETLADDGEVLETLKRILML